MTVACEPEQPSQFAFRIVEASGENVWYAALVDSCSTAAMASEIALAANELQPDSAVVRQVLSAETAKEAIRSSISRIWIGWGFEEFDTTAWSKLDQARSRLERVPSDKIGVDSTIVALVMTLTSFADLQRHAPNLASWIGGSVFYLTIEGTLSASAREARLAELRRWGKLSDADVIKRAVEGLLPPDPYYAEWLVLLDRGDLLGNG